MSVEAPAQPEHMIDTKLSLLEHQVDRLEVELDEIAGTGQYPEWWQGDMAVGALGREMRTVEPSPESVSAYFDLVRRQQQIEKRVSSRPYDMNIIDLVSTTLGDERVAAALAAEGKDGPIIRELIHELADSPEGKTSTGEVALLMKAYGQQHASGLLGMDKEAVHDDLYALLRKETSIKAMREIDQPFNYDDPWSMTLEKHRAWMRGALSAATGLSETEADDYVFAASRRDKNQDFVKILDRFEYFGKDRLEDVARFSGIHAFECYSRDQIELMELLASDPEAAAERLKNHDVNVVMVNRVGDYSGILNDTAETFEDGKGRTLFFEINKMSDIYKYMRQLNHIGIKPSNLMLAVHGAPGKFAVADERDPTAKRRDIAMVMGRSLIDYVNAQDNLHTGDRAHSLHDLAQLVDETMQPSRGLDNDVVDIDRIKLLFFSCDAASEVEGEDIDESGVKFSMGMNSIVGHLGAELAERDMQEGVDVYGAPNTIQMHKTQRGVRYSSTAREIGKGRSAQHAVRIRVDGRTVKKDEVDEIILSKAA